MTWRLTTTIASISGMPLDGVQVDFVTVEPDGTVRGVTDAGGVLSVHLAPDIAYAVGTPGAIEVDGTLYPAGTVLRFTTPAMPEPIEGVEPPESPPLTLTDITPEVITLNLPAVLARLESLEDRLSALEGGV